MTKRSKPFQRTIATPRIDPEFENWMDAWTPHSVEERAAEAYAQDHRR